MMASHTRQIHFTSYAVALCARYRRSNLRWTFFKDPEFSSFRNTLDTEMKQLKGSTGVRSGPKQAEAMTDSKEEIL